jgi:hypothetical protein
MIAWESNSLSLDQQEQFWRHVLDFETAPTTTDFARLSEAGVELPPPDAIVDDCVASKLSEIISALARLRVFITHTDHLSDGALYTVLWHDTLRTEIPMSPEAPGGAWHVDILGGWSDADMHTYLRYYADDEDRRHWRADFPDYDMPEHEDLPYDRDRFLPQPD